MFATIRDCQAIAAIAQRFNVDLPRELARPLETYAAVQAARSSPRLSQAREALTALMKADDVPTVDALDDLLDRLALRHARAQITREVSESAEALTLQVFRQALMGDGGDELFASLRPAFDEAAGDLTQAMSLLTVGMTAERAINAGPETVAAWTDAPAIVERLNAFTRLVTPIWREMDLVGNDVVLDHYLAKQAAFFIDATPEHAPDLTGAGVGFGMVQGHISEYRLGSWQSMVTETGHRLRLNSPREADALCRAHALGSTLDEEADEHADELVMP